MHFIFVDLDGQFTQAITEEMKTKGSQFPKEANITMAYHTGSVAEIPMHKLMHEHVAYISPSNSLLFFDGGIDKTYSETMFSDLQQKARIILYTDPLELTKLNRPYLPVGSAQMVEPTSIGEIHGTQKRFVICAPTMFLPQDVSTTDNAYLAMRASLITTHLYAMRKKIPLSTIVIPPLCCGYGKMTPSQSAKQVIRAMLEYHTDKGFKLDERYYIKDDIHFIDPSHNKEQPQLYMNTELPT